MPHLLQLHLAARCTLPITAQDVVGEVPSVPELLLAQKLVPRPVIVS